jgi:hypothetical protein
LSNCDSVVWMLASISLNLHSCRPSLASARFNLKYHCDNHERMIVNEKKTETAHTLVVWSSQLPRGIQCCSARPPGCSPCLQTPSSSSTPRRHSLLSFEERKRKAMMRRKKERERKRERELQENINTPQHGVDIHETRISLLFHLAHFFLLLHPGVVHLRYSMCVCVCVL